MGREKKKALRGGRALDEIDLLPQALREQSLSDREIILPYQQALEALSVPMRANWVRLGWEGWVNYPDGRHGQTPGGVRGADGERKREKGGQIPFIAESHGCRATMNREQQAWDAHLVLCFCRTATPPEEELALHGMKNPFAQEGKFGSAIALPFDQFQLGHMSFNHAVIDPPGETSSHGIFVFLYPSSKGLEFRKLAAFHLGKPG